MRSCNGPEQRFFLPYLLGTLEGLGGLLHRRAALHGESEPKQGEESMILITIDRYTSKYKCKYLCKYLCSPALYIEKYWEQWHSSNNEHI